MQLNKTKKGYYVLLTLSVTMLFLLGGWWLYLVFKLANQLSGMDLLSIEGNLINMIRWEGLTFFIFLLILTITFLYLYFLDLKKTRALQAFFASLTHELKTPLASIKLQAQVINDYIEDVTDTTIKDRLSKYTQRLCDDSVRLEDQLDNHLQLSRVERSAPLNLRSIELLPFFQKELKRYENKIHVKLIDQEKAGLILADDFALQTIFRNLIENSLKHSKQDSVEITLTFTPKGFHYKDNGDDFDGDVKRLGELFYKHNSPKGSGIGIFLIQRLAHKMHATINLNATPKLEFDFYFQPGVQDA